MAPEVFKHRKYDKKVDVFSFAMILYEVMLIRTYEEENKMNKFTTSSRFMYPQLMQMLEGDPPLANYEPYEAAKYVAEGHRPTFRSKGYVPDLRE